MGEEEGTREGAFSQALCCLDVKDAFLQVPQEKPLKVNLKNSSLRKGIHLDRELEQKHGFSFSQGT